MNWFDQNRWLGTFFIVLGITTIAAIYFLFSAKNSSNEALEHYQEAVREKNRLEQLDPFPSEPNYRKMKGHLDNYTAALNKLKEELKARAPNPPPLAPNEFQTHLRQSMLAVAERARTNKVKLPDNFALGFDEYTTALPTTSAAPVLGQELTQIETLLNLLIDAHIDGITALARKPLPDERGAAATPTQSPRPAAGGAAVSPQLVERGIVDVSFAATPSASRKVLNQIVSSPQQIYVVRLVHVRDEKDKGPPREQPAQAGTAGPQPAPVKPPATGALNFIVGNEHIQVNARVELLRFTF